MIKGRLYAEGRSMIKENCTSERLLVLQYKMVDEWHDLRIFRSYESLNKAIESGRYNRPCCCYRVMVRIATYVDIAPYEHGPYCWEGKK